MLNRCSTDIYLEYEVQLILSEIEAVEDILKENRITPELILEDIYA